MTRTLSRSVPEKATVNRGASASTRYSEPAGRLPKFVDHPELKGRWAYKRLFIEAAEPTLHHSAADRELHHFKRMHFCGRRMKMLLERHGRSAARRSDYERFARLHQQFRDDIASDNVGLVYHLYKRERTVYLDGDELLSEGMMALARAIDTFNPWLGFRFSTYACNAIHRAFYRHKVQRAKRQRKESMNLESWVETGDWLDTCRTEESILYAERLRRVLSGGAADLTPIEDTILAQRFPLIPEAKRRTLAGIGLNLGFSKERVRQIEKLALAKLRAALDRDPVLNPDPPAVLSGFARIHLEDTTDVEASYTEPSPSPSKRRTSEARVASRR
jgi:RNA polymerase sigma factor (sigma-70 family)